MRNRFMAVFLAVLMLFSVALPAFADIGGITSFGYNDLRDRSSGVTSLDFWGSWSSDFGFNGASHSQYAPGTSYSQPLIAYDTNNPNPQNIYIIAAGGGTSPRIAIWKAITAVPGNWQDNPPVWSDVLHGTLATTSHPSLYDMNGHYIVFIGTNNASGGAHIMGWDVTSILKGQGGTPIKVLDQADPNASDIVSAPLLEYWQDQQGQTHPVLIYTDGDASQIDVMTGIDSLAAGQMPTIPPIAYGIRIGPGGGRTSSSPAPVMNGTAFVIGWDGGGQGAIYVYRLNDILTIDGNGNVAVKSNAQPYDAEAIHAGMDQSFSVQPSSDGSDGSIVYFGDSRSNIYGYDTSSDTWLWSNKTIPNKYGYPGDFSDRSPALDDTDIFFPFGTSPDHKSGGVIAANKSTGNTDWISPLVGYDQYGNSTGPVNAQTAPVVANVGHPSSKMIIEGLGNGQIVGLDPSKQGQEIPLTGETKTATQISSYASGITGEISLYGNYAAIGYDSGIVAFSLLPMDLAVTGLTITDPSGKTVPKNASGDYVVEAGQTYTVKADYQYVQSPSGDPNDPSWNLPQVPVAGLHGVYYSDGWSWGLDWYSFNDLTNSAGQGLPQKSLTSEYSETPHEEFYVDLQHQVYPGGDTSLTYQQSGSPGISGNSGSQSRYDFRWTPSAADASSTNFIGAAINMNFHASNPLVQMYPDSPLTNNLAEIPVKIEAPKLVVTPASATIQVGQHQQFAATYYPLGQGNSPGQDVTTAAVWTSSDTGVATVGYSTGLATGQGGGTTTITAQYAGLTGTATLMVEAPVPPPQSGGVQLQAISQIEHDFGIPDGTPAPAGVVSDPYVGMVQPVRPPGTAEWTDYVTATVTPPTQSEVGTGDRGTSSAPSDGSTIAPPEPGPAPGAGVAPPLAGELIGSYSIMDSYRIQSGTLIYPLQSLDYSWGNPAPPEGTTSTPMTPSDHSATGTLRENWAHDGAPVIDLNGDEVAQYPKDYTITAQYHYAVNYHEEYDYRIIDTETGTVVGNKTVFVNHLQYSPSQPLQMFSQLKVDGTGALY